MRKHLSTVLLIVVLIAGISLILYPTVSDCWNSLHQSRAMEDYWSVVSELDAEETESLWREAERYNKEIVESGYYMHLPEEVRERYSEELRLSGSDVMCNVEIPKIKVNLPVYHGTEEDVLQKYVGHFEGTSLPVGGPDTHCVLMGHRGLSTARLFTDLDQMEAGDIFILRTLGRELTYEVDRIAVVLPEELEELGVVRGEDYCTLVTCTPYGVNSHRLLVRGRRTENRADPEVISEVRQIGMDKIAIAAAVPALTVGLPAALFWKKRRQKPGR